MNTNETYEPVPWWGVLLAAVPGVLLALSRGDADVLGSLLSMMGVLYLVTLVAGVVLSWYRGRRFPVWALIPTGALAWVAVTLVAVGLSSMAGPYSGLRSLESSLVLVQGLIAAILFLVLLRGRRAPAVVWVLTALLFTANLFVIAFIVAEAGSSAALRPAYLTAALAGPVEGLMLLAVGLLAVRRHNVLALLVVLGGYAYMLTDSDFLFGSLIHDWAGLTTYLIAMAVLFLVVTPIGFLRARTRSGRAAALFIPVTLFAVARLVIPALVLGDTGAVWPGDTLISVNLVLVLAIGWLLYEFAGQTRAEALAETPEMAPSSG